MSDPSMEDWYKQIAIGCAPYLAGTVEDAWNRCLPIWREKGRIEDMPYGIRFTRYSPWWGKHLAREFSSKFRSEFRFLFPFLDSNDEFLQIAAVELLRYMYESFDQEQAPPALVELPQALPTRIKKELESDWITCGKGINTVGDFVRFEE